ncbi:MAG TPA: HAD-IIA family hydrolase [Ktedonobacteraceae bacterium]|nr:HAD-IIA family hydrolase [Ktedonobacteraceae bacterium]
MLAEQFDAFLLDLDGVVYIGNAPLPHTVEVLKRLRNLGKLVRFLTNDPGPSRKQLVVRLQKMGIEAREEEAITAGWATALYLTQHQIGSAYVVGSSGLCTELEEAGIHVTNEEEDRPEAVVIGCDDSITYRDIRQATRLIHRGAAFIATSADLWFPTLHGPMPAVGTVVEAIRVACNKQPLIVGKPYPTMFQEALLSCGNIQRVVMIGDTPTSDILGAHQVGIPALLVVRGPAPQFSNIDDLCSPDACISDLSGLFDPQITIRPREPLIFPN